MSEQSPTDYKIRLGAKLEDLRRSAGKDKAEAASKLKCSESKIGRIERGDVSVVALELDALLDLYDVRGEDRADLEHLGDEARRRRPRTPWGSAIPERIRRMFRIEETATRIRVYDAELVHGLLQTEDYARAVMSANAIHRPGDVERLVQARMARQTRLSSSNPPELTVVLSEAVVRLLVGGPEVMRAQLRHLVDMARQPFISIRLIPFSVGAHVATGNKFTILTPAGSRNDLAYLETLTDSLFVDEPDRVATYQRVFAELLKAALSPADTLKRLDIVSSEL